MAKSHKPIKESKFRKIIKSPLKILIKIRDFYISSLIICDGQMGYGNYAGCPTAQVTTLPKSFSVNSSRSSSGDEDLRELIRAASARKLGNKVELEVKQRRENFLGKNRGGLNDEGNVVPRSQSVGIGRIGRIGRIDEDEACEFGGDVGVNVNGRSDLFPRSRSHAVSSKRL